MGILTCRALFVHHATVVADVRAAQVDGAIGAFVGIEKFELDLRVVVAAARRCGRTAEFATGKVARPSVALPARSAPEELLEEVTVQPAVTVGANARVRELEPRIPVGRRTKLVPVLRMRRAAERVVSHAPFGIGQHSVGFVQLHHLLGRIS